MNSDQREIAAKIDSACGAITSLIIDYQNPKKNFQPSRFAALNILRKALGEIVDVKLQFSALEKASTPLTDQEQS